MLTQYPLLQQLCKEDNLCTNLDTYTQQPLVVSQEAVLGVVEVALEVVDMVDKEDKVDKEDTLVVSQEAVLEAEAEE